MGTPLQKRFYAVKISFKKQYLKVCHDLLIKGIHSYCRCNRYKEQAQARVQVEKARAGMVDEYVKTAKETETQSLERFKHYFSRYSNHLNSLEVSVYHHMCVSDVV